jgi:hypothetical protein
MRTSPISPGATCAPDPDFEKQNAFELMSNTCIHACELSQSTKAIAIHAAASIMRT